MTESSAPPIAPPKPYRYTRHGITVEDPYHWLRDPDYPKVTQPEILAYLNAENRYFEAVMAPHAALVETLFAELKARQQPDEAAVPWKDGNYEYQWRFATDAQYRIWRRWPVGKPDEAETILDEPALAAGLDYFALGGLDISPNGRYLAYATDTDGSERFTVRVKDLHTGELLPDTLSGIAGGIVWANDNATLFYVELTENWRPYLVKSHRLGQDVATDRHIYQESGGTFFVSIDKTQSEAYLLIGAGDHVTSEIRFIPADAPDTPPRLIAPRRTKHEYDVEHHGDFFYIRTNDTHKNFRLVRAPRCGSFRVELAERHRRQRSRLSDGPRLFCGFPRARRARRRSRSDPHSRLRRQRTHRCLPGSVIRRGPRHQRGIRNEHAAARLRVDGHAADRLRLRPRDANADHAQSAAGAVGIRREPICHGAIDGFRARRRARADLDRVSQGLRTRRIAAALPVRLWRIRRRDVAELLERALVVARPWFCVRDRTRPRRRRIGLWLVRSRQTRPTHEHVPRLHRRRVVPDPNNTTQSRAGSLRSVAARAVR